MKRRSNALIIVALWIAGCSSSQMTVREEPAQTGRAEDQSESGLSEKMSALDGALDQELSREVLDCPKAKELKEQICELAEKICELEGDRTRIDTPRDDAGSLCEDARQRCEKARARYSGRCGSNDM